ncbi:hypothetical protein ACPD8N_00530 [Lacticaseibacillus chiayiensis]|uniref:hypothetical protein n=1 Tax=Lacticaseibacillus chiayiensis TaxID=2100821 RepID=UPI003C7764CF
MQPVLLATVHHPNVSLPQLQQVVASVSKIFSSIYVTISSVTTTDITHLRDKAPKFHCRVIDPHGAADARRKVLESGLRDVQYAAPFFYCDFDKVVVAVERAESALETFVNHLQVVDGYQIVGRDSVVMRTYPATWRETEAITNKAASAVFGLPDLDITAGCCAFSQEAARYILANSEGLLTDTEWPMLCKAAKVPITAIKVSFLPYDPVVNAGRDDDNWRGYASRLRLAYQALQSLEQGADSLNRTDPLKQVRVGWPYNGH